MPPSDQSRKSVKFVDWDAIRQKSQQRRFETAQRLRKQRREERLDAGRGGPRALGMMPDEWQHFHASQVAARQQELAALAPTMPAHHATDEKPLGEYLIRRNADDRSIQGQELDRLRAANRSVEETRERLDVGRGNVVSDIQQSGNASTHGTIVARDLANFQWNNEFHPFGVPSDMRFGQISATSAELTRSGNCGEHADLATHVHATRLQTNETVGKMSGNTVDHAWSELRDASGQASSRDVVMDAWAHGPAVLREDSKFASNPNNASDDYHYNSITAVSGSRHMDQLRNTFQNSEQVQQSVAHRFGELQAENYAQTDHVYASTDVMASTFVHRTSQAINNWSPMHQQLQAVSVARSLGATVHSAVGWSEEIFPPKR